MGEREKGVATAPCPSCGKDRPLAEQADGGTAATNCPDCYPAPEPEKASKSAPAREQGTPSAKEES